MACDHCGPTEDDAVCACGCSAYEDWCGCDECLRHHWRSSSADNARIRELQDFGKPSGRQQLPPSGAEELPLTSQNDPLVAVAEARAVVKLLDGRTGRLQWVAKRGGKCRIKLPSGAYINVPRDEIIEVDLSSRV